MPRQDSLEDQMRDDSLTVHVEQDVERQAVRRAIDEAGNR